MFRIWPKDEVLVVEICQNTKDAHTLLQLQMIMTTHQHDDQ